MTLIGHPSTSWVKRLLADQPDPTGGGDSVTRYALLQCTDPRVAELLVARREQGIERYGLELRVGDGRDTWADWVQERVDSLIYARKLQLEGLDDGTLAKLEEQTLRLGLSRAGWRE